LLVVSLRPVTQLQKLCVIYNWTECLFLVQLFNLSAAEIEQLKWLNKSSRTSFYMTWYFTKPRNVLCALHSWNCEYRLRGLPSHYSTKQGILKGKYHCTVDLLFDWFGISCMTTDNFCFYLQNRIIQTSQTGGQLYSDISPFSIPCTKFNYLLTMTNKDEHPENH